MNIKKCDRCGKIYEPKMIKSGHSNHRIIIECDDKVDCYESKNHRSFDLCPTCACRFAGFFSEGGQLKYETITSLF